MSTRLAAAIAVVTTSAGLAGLAVLAVVALPHGLLVVLLVGAAAFVARGAVLRRGRARTLRLVGAAALVALAAFATLRSELILWGILCAALVGVGMLAAHRALRVHGDLPTAPRPRRPVVVYNERSGGGKAARFRLADEARRRGITPIELTPDADLEELVRAAVADGADALAAAGGDGTQAIVAAVAAEHGLPFACIPAGTRNHFALDLGVDRGDVVGALDAFVDGRERVVDLAEVNGRVFVNNVSLGLYAEAVQRDGYRDAKLRTILDTAPELAEGGAGSDLTWCDADGDERTGAAVVLVSNNVYRLGRVVGTGTRPRLDEGRLGIAVLEAPGRSTGSRLWSRWARPDFAVTSTSPVPLGVDGEAVVLDPPLRFTSRPGALRVRVAPHHPGASPSALLPDGVLGGFGVVWRLALGRPVVPGGRHD